MRIDGLSSGQTQGIQNIGDVLSKLQVGDIIKAKILEIAGGEVLLKMFDGAEFKAATAAKIDAKPGDTLELVVSGREDGRLFMETVKRGDGSDKVAGMELKLLLEKLDFKPNEINMGVASSLKATGLPISKDIVDKAVSLMKQFSQISSDNAVFLASKGIAPPDKNTAMLINLLDGKLKLGKGLDELQKLLSTVAGELTDLSENNLSNKSDLSGSAGKLTSTSGLNSAKGAELPVLTARTEIPNKQINQMNINIQDAASGNMPDDMLSSPKALIETPGSKHLNIPTQDTKTLTNQSSVEIDQSADILLDKSSENFSGLGKNSSFSDEDLFSLQLAAKNKGETATAENIKDTAKTAVKMLKDAGDLFVKVESDSFKSDIEIKKLLGNILDRLDNLKELLQNTSIPGRDELLNKLGTVEDNMKLLNQVGNNTMYAQIPVNIQGFNTTAELFVMKREAHRKRIDPGNAVLFLSLDTHNIGTVQSIVEIKGKNVGVNLRAEMPEIIDYMKENMTSLYNSLSKSGFKLVDIRYRLISEPAGLADMERVIGEEFKERRKGVDLRI